MSRSVLVSLFLCPLLLMACNEAPFEAERSEHFAADVTAEFDARNPVSGQVQAQLARVRNLTAPFHNFDAGVAAGWFVELSECVEHPQLGGMGYHYGNPMYLETGTVDVMQPEVLLYEPMKNGKKRLVGVEYVLPIATDQDPDTHLFAEPDMDAPELFGQQFHWNPMQGLWALHVWIWRDNPSGMFADFNPKVSCQFAPEA